MTINERVKFFRKNVLHMNQTAFAVSIGMKQTSVSSFEKEGATVSEQSIKTISSVHGVREEWLRSGIEPMFIQTPSSMLDQLKKDFNLDDFSSNLIFQYLKLDPSQRQIVQDFFYKVVFNGNTVSTPSGELPKDQKDFETLYPPIDIDDDRKSS